MNAAQIFALDAFLKRNNFSPATDTSTEIGCESFLILSNCMDDQEMYAFFIHIGDTVAYQHGLVDDHGEILGDLVTVNSLAELFTEFKKAKESMSMSSVS